MPIPEYNAIKAPALQFFADGKEHKISEVFEVLAGHFKLSDAEKDELLPSGTQRRWHNRANWACYDLYRAGLLNRPKKGLYVITDLGKKIAAQKPAYLNREYLMQFPQFAEFMKKTNEGEKSVPEVKAGEEATPEEKMEAAFTVLQTDLKAELLDRLKSMDPYRFERLVIDLLVAMGYGGSREEAAQVTKASNDEGVDGVIKEDRLGLDLVYVQAKRWKGTVGRPDVQSFVGALAGKQAHKGVFITTSEFAPNAKAYVNSIAQKGILLDGDRLAELMIEDNIGVSLMHAYLAKKVDSDYFEEE